jgi:hypothetical protein
LKTFLELCVGLAAVIAGEHTNIVLSSATHRFHASLRRPQFGSRRLDVTVQWRCWLPELHRYDKIWPAKRRSKINDVLVAALSAHALFDGRRRREPGVR